MTTDTKPRFQRSADTSLIVTLLSRAAVGELVPYSDIEKILGRDPRTHRAPAESAIRILMNEDGRVFECVPKEGYRRLADGEIVDSTNHIRERQYRLAKRATKRLSVVNTANLDDEGRRSYYTHLSIQGALQHVTASKSQKAIAGKVNGSTQQLAVAMTLKALAE